MVKAYISTKAKIEDWVLRILAVCYFLLFGGMGIHVFFLPDSGWGASVLLFFIGLMLSLFHLALLWISHPSYNLSETGITIRYGCGKQIVHPWEEVTQVCLCVINQGNDHRIYDEVIWCTFGQLSRTPPDFSLNRNFAQKILLHHRRILTVEYTEDRLDGFRAFYRKEIPDYREQMKLR